MADEEPLRSALRRKRWWWWRRRRRGGGGIEKYECVIDNNGPFLYRERERDLKVLTGLSSRLRE